MFCFQCGAQLPDGARFCLECGAQLPDRTPTAAARQAAAQLAPVEGVAAPANVTLHRIVTDRQIREEKLVEISDPLLPGKAKVRLRRSMTDGEALHAVTDGSAGPVTPFTLVLKIVPDSFEVHRTVTENQIRQGAMLVIEDERLPRAVRYQLQPDTLDGDRFQVKPGKGLSPFTPFFLVLHVTKDARP